MRRLPTVVAGESLVLVALAVAWLVGAGREPSLAVPADIVDAADAAAVRGAASGAAVATPGAPLGDRADAAPQRTRVDVGRSPSIVLHGRLLTDDGTPGPTDARVSLQCDDRWGNATVIEGVYAVAGLSPGRWYARVRSDEFVSIDTTVELDGEPLQTRDFVLSRAQRLDVFLRTPEGGQLQAALAGKGLRTWDGLSLVAVAEPLTADLPPGEARTFPDVGIGRFRNAWNQGGKLPGPADPDGTLWLDRPPPATAVLLLRNAIVEQRTITPGQQQLTFVVAPDGVFARTATVRGRVVDGINGGPLAGAQVSLGASQAGSMLGAKTDDKGALSIERVPPGKSWLNVQVKGHETLIRQLTIAPGGDVDLGDVVLFAPVAISGQVAGADGKPVGADVAWTDLDALASPQPLISNRITRADGDGAFQLYGTGPRRLVVTARCGDGRIGYTSVDARGGAPAPLRILVVEPTAVVLTANSEPWECWFAMLRDTAGVVAATGAMNLDWRTTTLEVPPGDYTLQLHGNGGRLVKTVPIAARGNRIRVEVP